MGGLCNPEVDGPKGRRPGGSLARTNQGCIGSAPAQGSPGTGQITVGVGALPIRPVVLSRGGLAGKLLYGVLIRIGRKCSITRKSLLRRGLLIHPGVDLRWYRCCDTPQDIGAVSKLLQTAVVAHQSGRRAAPKTIISQNCRASGLVQQPIPPGIQLFMSLPPTGPILTPMGGRGRQGVGDVGAG